MRCIIVNDANLKADAFCACCRSKIGENYIREIGTRRVYCGQGCYGGAAELPIMAAGFRKPLLRSGTFGS